MTDALQDSIQLPAETTEVLINVGVERRRQIARWGLPSHPDQPTGVRGTANAFFGLPTEQAAKLLCEDAFRRGTGSNGHILLEEVCEAFAAIGDDEALVVELVQVAAVATAWAETIIRRRYTGTRGEVAHA